MDVNDQKFFPDFAIARTFAAPGEMVRRNIGVGGASQRVVRQRFSENVPDGFFIEVHAAQLGIAQIRVDGAWVGANGYQSYFFFPVDPGDHRLCTNMQSKLKRQVNASTAAATFTAEAGQSYYFRTKTQVDSGRIQLVPVDPAEAQILLASASFSTFQIKK